MVCDFGMYYIISVKVGVVFVKVDYLIRKFVVDFNEEKSKIIVLVSVLFFGVFGVKFSYFMISDVKDLD